MKLLSRHPWSARRFDLVGSCRFTGALVRQRTGAARSCGMRATWVALLHFRH